MNDNIFVSSREIPLFLRLKILFPDKERLLGLFLFPFLMIITIHFIKDTDFSDFTLIGSTETKGTVTNVRKTYSKIRKSHIFAFEYTFMANNETYKNTSYSRAVDNDTGIKDVVVQYLAKNPANSRIQNMRQRPLPIWDSSWILLFPLTTLIFAFYGLKEYLSTIPLLKNGLIASAKVIRTEKTNKFVKNQEVMQIFYEFEDKNSKKHEISTTSHEPKKLTNENGNVIFYDAQNPMKYVFKDNLATEITLKEDNTFKSPSIFGVIIILVLLVMALYAFWIGTDYLWCTFMN